jgi:hypothetical protein
MKSSTVGTALMCLSFPALAGPEAGAVVGYDLMSPSTGASAQGGLMLGARGGFRTDGGIALDAQILRHASSSGGLSTSEMVAGLGVRYFFVDADLSPFVSSHLNYHTGAKLHSGSESQAAANSSGIGLDIGGGLRIAISDLIYTDITTQYAMQFTGDLRHNTLGFGLGFGVTF